RFSKTNSFGFPIEKNENSNRQIWTGNNALSGVCLSWGGGLNVRGDDLEYSYDNGRVVLSKTRSANFSNSGRKK
ncbi:MAG: hypothetical protein NUV46_03390, partial [Nanoarchaeota archaeon]|nr:hypothetical protein [Nanoarchaeota archaeon]